MGRAISALRYPIEVTDKNHALTYNPREVCRLRHNQSTSLAKRGL